MRVLLDEARPRPGVARGADDVAGPAVLAAPRRRGREGHRGDRGEWPGGGGSSRGERRHSVHWPELGRERADRQREEEHGSGGELAPGSSLVPGRASVVRFVSRNSYIRDRRKDVERLEYDED